MNQDLLPAIVTMANVAFTVLRIAAHVPQLIAVVRDPCGARAISVYSWAMFALANGSNGIYALVMASDRVMFAINVLSAASCGTIATVAWIKQRRARKSEVAPVPAQRAAGPYRLEAVRA